MAPGAAPPPDRWNISQEALELLQQVFAVEPFLITPTHLKLCRELQQTMADWLSIAADRTSPSTGPPETSRGSLTASLRGTSQN